MKLQLLDTVEWANITQSMDAEFGEGVTKAILGNLTPIAISDRDIRTIYLIPVTWMSVALEEVPAGFDFHLAGKQLGVMTKDRFRLSLQILPELLKLTTKVLIVSKRGAEAFTYGRSILKESIVWYDPELKRGQRVLVVNEDNDCLGIAALSTDAMRIDRLSQDSLVGKNLVDIGWFIRRLG
ncbi:MAG: PUA domain-containing protein [Candidatus Thorarchaeota archaeon]